MLPQSKEIVKVSRQSVLSNFFQRLKRSINDVLLKGAKRLAKSDKSIQNRRWHQIIRIIDTIQKVDQREEVVGKGRDQDRKKR